MSEAIACPSCGRDDMVGLTEVRERCVDVKTGDVCRDEWTNDAELECGACDHIWTKDVAAARAILGRP